MRRGKQKPTVLACISCEALLSGTPSFCPSCGKPTSFASYQEKTAWEVNQWRSHSGRAAVEETYEPPPPVHVRATGTDGVFASTAVLERRHERKPDPVAERWERAKREEAARVAAEEGITSEATSEEPREEESRNLHAVPQRLDEEESPPEPVEAAIPPQQPDIAAETTLEIAAEAQPELAAEAQPEMAAEVQPDMAAIAPPVAPDVASDASWAERMMSSLLSGRIDRPFLYRRCMQCGASDWVLRAGGNDDGTWRYWCVRCGTSFRTDLRIPHAAKPWLLSAAVLSAVVLGAIRFA